MKRRGEKKRGSEVMEVQILVETGEEEEEEEEENVSDLTSLDITNTGRTT